MSTPLTGTVALIAAVIAVGACGSGRLAANPGENSRRGRPDRQDCWLGRVGSAVLALATIDTSIGLTAAAVETAIRRRTGPIQAPVDLVTAAIKTSGCVIPAGVCGPVGTRVEMLVDSVALTIQPLLNPITAPIGTIFNSVARVLGHRAATNAH